MDSISEGRLVGLHPALAAKARQHLALAAAAGVTLRVDQGFRSYADQASLYVRGRTAPGPVVTNAPPGYSWHEFGLAYDIAALVAGAADWDASHPDWKTAVKLGESIGLTAGAEWHHADTPHFQLTGSLPVSPDDRTRQLFQEGGLQAVWDATGLPEDAALSPA